jgi:hypothetical protein
MMFMLVVWFTGLTVAPTTVGAFNTEAACYQSGIIWEKRAKEYNVDRAAFTCVPVKWKP